MSPGLGTYVTQFWWT